MSQIDISGVTTTVSQAFDTFVGGSSNDNVTIGAAVGVTATLADNLGGFQARFDDVSYDLEIDVDGDGAVDMAIRLTNVSSADLDATDFNWN
jgi:hypothetical protein